MAPDGDWSHTRKACAQGLMDQDEWFGSFLAARPVARSRGDRLELVTEDGRRVEAHAEGGSEPSYEVTTTTSNPGQPSTTTAPATTVPDTTVPADQPPATTTSTSPPTTTPTTTSPPTTTTATVTFGPGGGSAEGFFGYEWHVVSVTGEGADPQYAGAVVDARTAGRVSVSGCNGAGGAMRLDSDRLVKDGDWAHTAMGCHPTAGGVDLEARDAWFEALLTDGPRVELTPDGLAATLRTGIAAVNLEHP